jgi:hypothetical protein
LPRRIRLTILLTAAIVGALTISLTLLPHRRSEKYFDIKAALNADWEAALAVQADTAREATRRQLMQEELAQVLEQAQAALANAVQRAQAAREVWKAEARREEARRRWTAAREAYQQAVQEVRKAEARREEARRALETQQTEVQIAEARRAEEAYVQAAQRAEAAQKAAAMPLELMVIPRDLAYEQGYVNGLRWGGGGGNTKNLPTAKQRAQAAQKKAETTRRHYSDLSSQIRIANLLWSGRLLYETRRTMEMKKPEVVLVRLDLGRSDIFEGIDNKAQFKLENVRVSDRMRLHLMPDPPDAFKVEPASPSDEEQALSNLSASTWMWNVTPLKPGEAKLILNVWALVEHGSKDIRYPLLTKTETITVRTTSLPEFNSQQFRDKVLDKIAESTGQGIAALIGSALTGIGIWIWRKWRKPKEPKAPAWETP